jgi:hypothetical protein
MIENTVSNVALTRVWLTRVGLVLAISLLSGLPDVATGQQPKRSRGADSTGKHNKYAAIRRQPNGLPAIKRGGIPSVVASTPIGLSGMRGTDINSFILRPRILVQGSAYSAPVRRMSLQSALNSLRNTTPPADIDAVIEEIRNAKQNEERLSAMMLKNIRSKQKRYLTDAWAYFADANYLRARMSFEAAELVDSRSAVPRFGQVMVDVVQGHFRRAMTQLARLYTYDARRPAYVPGMFEYNMSLQSVFQSPDELGRALVSLRDFAQRNNDNAPVQALYCYVLWYSRFPDAMIEASSIASRLARTTKNSRSPWAQFDRMIVDVREKSRQHSLNQNQKRIQNQDTGNQQPLTSP